MRPELAAVAARQGGLVTRRQAVEAGYTQRELRALVRPGGGWITVRRGVYVERELWDRLDPYDGEGALIDRAVQLTARVPHVLSHDSAGRAHGLPMLRPKPSLAHITRPGVGGCRTECGVKHHLSLLAPGHATAHGLRVTDLPRTALDLGREHGFDMGVVACDAVLRRGVSVEKLTHLLDGMSCWPGITRARAAVDHADSGAESAGESLARLLVIELGLGRPETQFPVRIGDQRTAWCDLRLGCHVFEFDGRVKYRRAENGGVATRPPEEVVWDEKNRERLVCAEGIGMSRIIWDDFWGSARVRALHRLRQEYAITEARFGARLPAHLEDFARRLRGGRSA